MISILPTIMATKTGIDLLRKAKDLFYPDKALSDAEAILRKRMADDVGSLQEQVRNHRDVMDKLVEQVRADKDLLEKHNEVLIRLGEAAEELAERYARLQIVCYVALGIAGVSLLVAILFKVLK